jgi:hypothetical protein
MDQRDVLLESDEPPYGPVLVDVVMGHPERARDVIDHLDAGDASALAAELLEVTDRYCSTGRAPVPRSRILAELVDAAEGAGPLVDLSAPEPLQRRAAGMTAVLVADPQRDRAASLAALTPVGQREVAWAAAVVAARALEVGTTR